MTSNHERKHANVSSAAHINASRRALGDEAIKRRRVYLDKCYWIALRDVQLGRTKDPVFTALLSELRRRASSGEVMCPIGDTVFFELMKQQDVRTRHETAALMDELGAGFAIRPYDELVQIEVEHLFLSASGRASPPLETLVWSKPAHVLGVFLPSSVPFADPDSVKKSFFDFVGELPLTKVLSTLESESLLHDGGPAVARINKDIQDNSQNIADFQSLYLDEIRGLLDWLVPVAMHAMARMKFVELGATEPLPQDKAAEISKMVYNLLFKAFEKDGVRKSLRTSHIQAMCYAGLRWDRKRKLKPNDMFDFRHAATAVAYCDAFFTERPLETLLSQRHLSLGRDFRCKVFSSQSSALEWLSA